MSGIELKKFFVHRAGVGMNEGSAFGPGGEGFMRMNLGPQGNSGKGNGTDRAGY